MRRGRLVQGSVVLATITLIAAVAYVASSGVPAAKSEEGGQAGAPQAAQAAPFDGRNDRVTVHGHWIIEVRSSNGAIVSRREFDNALQSGGQSDIVKILGRAYATGLWSVDLSGSNLGPCFVSPGGSRASCFITEAASGRTNYFVFKTLQVSMPTSGPDAGKLVLSGNATVQADGDIVQVATLNDACTPTTAPASPCPIGNITDTHAFTAATLATPIAVVAGQQVLVIVALSFN